MTSEEKVVDLTKIRGMGDFLCPTCGVIISPSDESDEVYEMSDVKLGKEDNGYLHLKCKKCNTPIRVIGFGYKPPDRVEIEKEYMTFIPLYTRLKEECCFILRGKLTEQGIKIHSLNSRIKSFESFYEKILRKKLLDPFEEVNDIAGVRIICVYRSDLEKIRDILLDQFELVRIDASSQSTSSFGYMSDHYVVKLPRKVKGARYDDLKELRCEIQVRTILMHAWATVSHHLDYKKDNDIPQDLRKDFDALSGLFFVADTHFEMFKNSVQTLRARLGQSIEMDHFDLKQGINLDSLSAYTEWKFPERESPPIDDYYTLINLLRNAGYEKIEDIDIVIEKVKEAVDKYEKKNYGKTAFTKTVVILYSLSLVDSRFKKIIANARAYRGIRKPEQETYVRARRDRLYIIAEILVIAKDGSLKTQIMYRANLSFAQLDEYLNFLLKRKLVKEAIRNGKMFYKTTAKGAKYLENYEAISNLLLDRWI